MLFGDWRECGSGFESHARLPGVAVAVLVVVGFFGVRVGCFLVVFFLGL